MTAITPVLLAGGSGTRLWPLSRKSYPKQFAKLIGEQSLFQQSALRLSTSEKAVFANPVTVTNSDFRFIVTEQLQEAGVDPGAILIEPSAKNTAPAILAACYTMHPDSILLVAPSDHVIPDTAAFHQAIADGIKAVEAGKIVTFGIRPTRPETGYGYLEVDAGKANSGPHKINRFVEKPNAKAADDMLKAGNFLWNAGIFMFRSSDMIRAFTKHAPELTDPVLASVTHAEKDLGFLRLHKAPWGTCKDVSIDYAVMEKADNLVAVPFSAGWSDLGDWKAVWEEQGPDTDGNVVSTSSLALDCKNTLLRSENEGQQLVGLGLDDIVAVAMPDAVLVAHKDRSQDVKKVVTTLKEQGASQSETFPKDHRPWGWYETLAIRGRFQVKRILVHPGASLSLQSHHHRSEHWIVVEGTAEVTVNDDVKLVTEGESVYIPLGAKHRMTNPGKLPMLLIEVQTGAYLGEDDIIRYEDAYARK